ncbi:hypothetical protein DPMN_040089 [Dreissena polymorpha]|uniref:Uncharacterized protein n=1 Tax=Dreissena polymorpha TaxID=45954 RepID=A0A9D4HUN7_DREPO|nr:hypothetical protein DPMN_040089 [Dreissena polymorpha]
MKRLIWDNTFRLVLVRNAEANLGQHFPICTCAECRGSSGTTLSDLYLCGMQRLIWDNTFRFVLVRIAEAHLGQHFLLCTCAECRGSSMCIKPGYSRVRLISIQTTLGYNSMICRGAVVNFFGFSLTLKAGGENTSRPWRQTEGLSDQAHR